MLDDLRGEHSIAELCRREGIAESLYYSWSKKFLEAGKRRLAGDTARAATNGEVKELRRPTSVTLIFSMPKESWIRQFCKAFQRKNNINYSASAGTSINFDLAVQGPHPLRHTD